jgi:hypothetical protein
MDTQISVAGNLTADPELRYTPTGAPVATLTAATARTSPDHPTPAPGVADTGAATGAAQDGRAVDVARTPRLGRAGDGVLLVDGARVVEGASGTIYLLHFHAPYAHARHYLGWAAPGHLGDRLAEHAAGHGARLTQVVAAAGIGWTLARTWPGTRWRERSLKRQGGASRRCPVCGVRPRFPEPPPAGASARAAACRVVFPGQAGVGGRP